jgi:hypothetical protein
MDGVGSAAGRPSASGGVNASHARGGCAEGPLIRPSGHLLPKGRRAACGALLAQHRPHCVPSPHRREDVRP